METKPVCKIKKNGIYYTPSQLAIFLAKPLLKKQRIKIFDPAYGEGALLLAAETLLHHGFKIKKSGSLLHGCDRAPLNGQLNHIPKSNLIKLDFFDYPFEQKFDIVLMNPPYVRHHLISNSKRNKYQKIISSLCKLKYTSDLWVYFLVKAIGHLREGGSIGAILPRSSLQAEYAQDVRKWLAERFLKIKILALGTDYFEEVQERIVMVWLHHFGKRVKSIKISFSQRISNNIKYAQIDRNKWEAPLVLFLKKHDIGTILDTYIKKYNFKKFEKIASVKIGIVTGCDDFFILSKSDIKQNGFSNKHLTPILNTSRNFSGLFLNGTQPSNYLLLLTPDCYQKYRNYIRKGQKAQYQFRAHSTRRKPWYRINLGDTPDAFFPYRTSEIPYLVINNKRVQCTNSIHRIYFEGLSENEIKWVQISLLSMPGQLSIEAFSKSYGSGVLKIEPSSLRNSIIHLGTNEPVDSIYHKISELLSSNRKIEAMRIATDFINFKLKISKRDSQFTASAFKELQIRRFERK